MEGGRREEGGGKRGGRKEEGDGGGGGGGGGRRGRRWSTRLGSLSLIAAQVDVPVVLLALFLQ